MTRPGIDGGGLAPARRNRGRMAPSSDADGTSSTEVETARGQADAVLGALARMQLRLDVIGREQSDLLHQLMDRVAALEARLHQD